MKVIKLIVGLGNISKSYINTRHNIGQKLIYKMSQKYGAELQLNERLNCYIGHISIKEKKIALACVNGYMNVCGSIVRRLSHMYRLKSEEILIVHDDIYLNCGCIKFKVFGGHGGHNGIRNIIKCLETEEFYRLRLGIGKPENESNSLAKYVLEDLYCIDKIIISDAIDISLLCIEKVIQNKYKRYIKNKKKLV